jgi:hypothetical protein
MENVCLPEKELSEVLVRQNHGGVSLVLVVANAFSVVEVQDLRASECIEFDFKCFSRHRIYANL